ncbi:MAG: hypothetical protein ACK5OX_16395 [Desertimonas sp.]
MRAGRIAALVAILAGVAFWTWALFFASKESINRIEDRAWAERAEGICVAARDEREALADFREMERGNDAMLSERAGLIDQATDIVEDALDEIVAVEPADDKGQEIVPQWEADYRRYIADRRSYTQTLRAGEDTAFSQTAVDGIPITERIERFANDNDMPTCAPPTDI